MKKLLVTTALVATMATSAFAQTEKQKVQEVAESYGYELNIDNKGMKKIIKNLIEQVWEKGHFLGIDAMIATVNDIIGSDEDNLGDLKVALQAVIDQKAEQEATMAEVFAVIADADIPFPFDFTISLADNVENFLTATHTEIVSLQGQVFAKEAAIEELENAIEVMEANAQIAEDNSVALVALVEDLHGQIAELEDDIATKVTQNNVLWNLSLIHISEPTRPY